MVINYKRTIKITIQGNYKMKKDNKFSSYYINVPIGTYNNETIYNIEKITSKEQEQEIKTIFKKQEKEIIK